MTSKPKCPQCKSKKYVVSIFGSICPECFYDPKKDGPPKCCEKCVGTRRCSWYSCPCHAKTSQKEVDAGISITAPVARLPIIPEKKCCCGGKYPNLQNHTVYKCWTLNDGPVILSTPEATPETKQRNALRELTEMSQEFEATPKKWEHDLDLLRGLAPKNSLKGRRTDEIKKFVAKLLATETAKAREEGRTEWENVNKQYLSREEACKQGAQAERDRIKQDLLRIAKAGEMEELRREVERYFAV